MQIETVEKSKFERRERQLNGCWAIVVKDFPAKIKNLRLARNITQGKLAKKLGVSKSQIRLWESGQSIPNINQINELVRLFKVPQSYLKQIQEEEYLLSMVKRESSNKYKGENNMSELKVVELTGETFGTRLRKIREVKGFERRNLSKELKVSYGTLGNWEKGVSTPSTKELIKIAKALNVSACQLLGAEPVRVDYSVKEEGMAIDTFASRIKLARRQKGIKQGQLADSLKVSSQSISAWEEGRTSPNIEALMKISDLLEAPLEFLLEGKASRFKTKKVSAMGESGNALPTPKELTAMNPFLSKRLKELRKGCLLSQGRLAKEIGVTSQVIYKWETGRSVPSPNSLQRLLDYFEMSLDKFLEAPVENSENVEVVEAEVVEKEVRVEPEMVSDGAESKVAVIEPSVKGDNLLEGELPEIIQRATQSAQVAVTETISQLTEKIVSEVMSLNQPASNVTALNETELALIEKVRQLEAPEMEMLQSYLDYLISKK